MATVNQNRNLANLDIPKYDGHLIDDIAQLVEACLFKNTIKCESCESEHMLAPCYDCGKFFCFASPGPPCRTCRRPESEHSHIGLICPVGNFSTTFKAASTGCMKDHCHQDGQIGRF